MDDDFKREGERSDPQTEDKLKALIHVLLDHGYSFLAIRDVVDEGLREALKS